MRFCFLVLLAAVWFGASNDALAHDDIHIVVSVREQLSNIQLKNASIEIKRDNEKYKTVKTSEFGIAEFYLPLDYGYHIYFKSNGKVTKYILIDTRNIPLEDQEGGFKLDLDISLFNIRKGFDQSLMEQPIGIAKYDKVRNAIDFDFDYTRELKVQIDKSKLETDELYQDKFDKIVSKGKFLEEKGNRKKARKLYQKAFKLIPSDEFVRRKLKYEVDDSNAIKS